MKKIIFLFCLLPILSFAQIHRCATDSLHRYKLATDLNYKSNYLENEKIFENQNFLKASINDSTYIIPVVVHVIYHADNAEVENVSDEQVQSQIDVLNEDFNILNENIIDVPAIWQPLVRNSKIKFILANTDTNGNYTTGITRNETNIIGPFLAGDSRIFDSSNGGVNGWNINNYLNIWVCFLSNNYLGFYQPQISGIPNSEGIVIKCNSFGRFKNTKAPYNYGRTATHEVGHWLNLVHIWGDDNGGCSNDDAISDTPKQANSNTRCPSFPKTDACTDTAPGIMYMNYMDYTDDQCMMFFTNRQVERMKLALSTNRQSLVTSNGLASPNINQPDVSIDSIENPVTYSVNRCFQPKVKIRNNGNTTQSNIAFNYAVSAGISKNYTWQDSILPGETKWVELETIGGDFGSNLFEVRIVNSDYNQVNNYKSASFRINNTSNFNCSVLSSISIYPNPVTNNTFLTVDANYSESQKATIKIYSNDGRLVYSNEFKFNPQDKLQLSNLNLSAGIYQLEFHGELNHDVKKFVVVNK